MKIIIRTGGLLGKYLPEGSERNLTELEVSIDSTVVDVLTQLNMPIEGSYLIIHNNNIVPNTSRETWRFKEGDELSIMPLLKGG